MSNDADHSLSTEPGGYRPSGGRRPQRGRKQSDSGRSLFANAIMVILVGGLVAAGWFIANQHKCSPRKKRCQITTVWSDWSSGCPLRIPRYPRAGGHQGADFSLGIKFANCGMSLTNEIAVG